MTVCSGSCGRELRPDDRHLYRHASGWLRQRSEGGSNQVTLPKYDGKLMCPACMDKMKRGLVNQEALW
jgi:hypothetical protein